MGKVNIDQLSAALDKELTLYRKDVTVAVKETAQESMNELVKETKAHKYKEDTGAYRRAISSRVLSETASSLEMQWYVKAPHHRKTHLLEYGHATRGGGRTVAYGNLGKSSNRIIEDYIKKTEEAIKNA